MGKRFDIQNKEDLLKIVQGAHPEFDYSSLTLEEYKDKKRVSFICSDHGLQSKNIYDFVDSQYGCQKCAFNARNKWKMLSKEDFIKKAKKVHGDKYDYSKVEDFEKQDEKVTIVCPEHGEFTSIIRNHLAGEMGCKECRNEKRRETLYNKFGVKNISEVEEVKQKKIDTSRKHWGTDYPCQNEFVQQYRESCTEDKYGTDNPQKNKNIREKTEKTNLIRYGKKTYLFCGEYRKKFPIEWLMAKSKEGMFEKYGMYHSQTEEAKKKQKEFFDSEYYKKVVIPQKLQREYETKKKNGTFSSSKAELEIKKKLENIFNSVKHQYRSDEYPFNCDFYIEDIDTYVEINFHWTHGSKPFEGTKEDVELLDDWLDKGTDYYNVATNVWANRDVLKRETAERNNLNYIMLYNEEQFNNFVTNIVY